MKEKIKEIDLQITVIKSVEENLLKIAKFQNRNRANKKHGFHMVHRAEGKDFDDFCGKTIRSFKEKYENEYVVWTCVEMAPALIWYCKFVLNLKVQEY